VSTVHHARWVLPISQPPIENGWVEIDAGRVIAVGREHRAPSTEHRGPSTKHRGPSTKHPDSGTQHSAPSTEHVILPGLVNAHTHLELSWMRNQVPPARSMPQWVERLMALRRTVGHEPSEPIADAIRESRAAGTVLFGDVTNTLASYEPLASSGMSAAVFRELLGFNVADPDGTVKGAQAQLEKLRPVARLRSSVVPHAPYSVSPALLRAIADASKDALVSIHLGESPEELDFLGRGGGAWRRLLTSLGVWTDQWRPPGTGPVDYVASHGLLNQRLLAVHCVHLTERELAMLAEAGASVVTCPRSNQWVGAGVPPIESFYRSGVRVAVGTDSLASVGDLNVFSELRLMRQIAPGIPAREILASATRHGADALGFGDTLGTIEPGKRADLITVSVPEGAGDVEEYLLSGIEPDQVRWLQ
jgi:aminodeoxyfutalosine deaminase